MPNIYKSYDEMLENIVNDIKNFSSKEQEYINLSSKIHDKIYQLYDCEKFKDNLKRFYEKKYDYLPKKENY